MEPLLKALRDVEYGVQCTTPILTGSHRAQQYLPSICGNSCATHQDHRRVPTGVSVTVNSRGFETPGEVALPEVLNRYIIVKHSIQLEKDLWLNAMTLSTRPVQTPGDHEFAKLDWLTGSYYYPVPEPDKLPLTWEGTAFSTRGQDRVYHAYWRQWRAYTAYGFVLPGLVGKTTMAIDVADKLLADYLKGKYVFWVISLDKWEEFKNRMINTQYGKLVWEMPKINNRTHQAVENYLQGGLVLF